MYLADTIKLIKMKRIFIGLIALIIAYFLFWDSKLFESQNETEPELKNHDPEFVKFAEENKISDATLLGLWYNPEMSTPKEKIGDALATKDGKLYLDFVYIDNIAIPDSQQEVKVDISAMASEVTKKGYLIQDSFNPDQTWVINEKGDLEHYYNEVRQNLSTKKHLSVSIN